MATLFCFFGGCQTVTIDMDELVHSPALVILITNIVLTANIKSQVQYIARGAMFLKNMTDYVYSSRCAPCINVGPRFAGKIKSKSTARSRSRALPDSPGGRRAGGEKLHQPFASLAIRVASRVAALPSSPVPGAPGEAPGLGTAASGRALDPFKSGVSAPFERAQKIHPYHH
jgi:hypothetical protein